MADWQVLGDVNYRKLSVYEEMSWGQLDLDNYVVYGAPYGGPIALIRDDASSSASEAVSVSSAGKKDKISVYTAAGKKISDIDFGNKSKYAGIGWSNQQHLILVFEDGNVMIFDVFGRLMKNTILIDASVTTRIIECRFWGDGLVAIASDYRLHVIDGLASRDFPTLRVYPMLTNLSSQRPYTAIEIIPPLLSRSGLLEVLLGTVDGSIIVVDEREAQDQLLQELLGSTVTKIAVAPNGRFLACYRQDGWMTVTSASFDKRILDFDTQSMARPLQIEWCGEDSVALLWKNTGIVIVGPRGDWINFSYEDTIQIVSEHDCCRIVSSSKSEIIQRVPSSTESIKRIGSTEPAALLYDAMEAFREGDPRSDEIIRSIIRDRQLEQAVISCVDAAAAEFDVEKQQSFLRAASYGKSFASNMDPTYFVDTARKLRVLNNIRNADIGIPLTMQELTKMGCEALIGRLTIQNHHLLALSICDLLKLRKDRVLVHWACEKVKRLATTTSSDEEIRLAIDRRLSGRGAVSHVEIADSAFLMGRRRLATMILDMEQNAAEQIPFLLKMKEDELALQKATNSSNADLIFDTLIRLQKTRDQDSFFRNIHSYPDAINLLKKYYKCKVNPSDRSLLHSLLAFEKNFTEAGTACWIQAYAQSSFSRRIQYMKESGAIFSQGRDSAQFKPIIDEQIDLLEYQRALDIRYQPGKSFIGLTVIQTARELYLLASRQTAEASRWDQEALKFVKKFKVTEKAIYYLRVDILAESQQWAALSKFSNEKKPPIGLKYFALASLKHGADRSEVERYIEKIDSKEEKYDLYVDLELWMKAAETAFKLKDSFRLQETARLSRSQDVERTVQDMLTKI